MQNNITRLSYETANHSFIARREFIRIIGLGGFFTLTGCGSDESSIPQMQNQNAPILTVNTDIGPNNQTPQLAPSANWTGIAGSGFTSAPTDPVRTTAKPALRLITPPFQWFTDTIDVGVMAAANDSDSLHNTLGVESVTFHYEGNSATVGAPSWYTIPTQRGPRTYYGWWVKLKKPADTAGHGHLYVEATARDATMQKRVMGPYIFSPQTSLYDAELTITPSQAQITGSRYQSLTAAIAWVKTNGRVNPLLTITEPGTYNFGTSTGELYTNPGYVNVTATVPVTLGRTAAQYNPSGASNLLNDRCKLRLIGPNLTLDFRYCLAFEHSAAVPSSVSQLSPWLDGVTVTTSEPLGSDADFAASGIPRSVLTSGMMIGAPWFTEVAIDGLHNSMIGAKVIRGCSATGLGADIANSAALILQSRFEGSDNTFWNDDRPAFSVQYTGAEAAATIARSGNVLGGNGGIWTVNLGATSYTFDTGRPAFFSTAQGRYFADLVAWLNTLPDVTASLLIEPFDRVASSGSLPGFAGQGFGATSIKSAPLTIVTNCDIHGDFYQHQGGGNLENSIIAFNEVLDYNVQILFLSPPSPAPRSEIDVLIFGNIFHAPGGDPVALVGGSQWGRPNLPLPASHVVIAHNSWVNQQFLIRNEGGGLAADAYSLMKNNVIDNLSVIGGAVANLTIDGLHLSADGAGVPTGATNVSLGGDAASLFADETTFDFSPAGELLANKRKAALRFDNTRTAFATIAPIGALA